MNSFNQTLMLSLSLLLLLHNAVSIDPLFSSCSTSNNYTSTTDPFGKNLNQLLFQLATNSRCTGYAIASVDQGPNKVNGLAICRGDVNATNCNYCVRNANAQIRRLCPLNKQGLVYFDECLVRYSDTEFFGKIDTNNTFILVNTQNVSSILPPEEFYAQVTKLMNSLKEEAYGSPLFYAAGTMEIGAASEMLYGLAQCTRDLSSGDCEKCLESAIAELPGCCGGMRGGRVVGGSCSVRYELYPFYKITP